MLRDPAFPEAHVPADSSVKASGLKLTGSGATETAFKALAPGKGLLHLATHGFFIDPDCPGSPPDPAGVTRGQPDEDPGDVTRGHLTGVPGDVTRGVGGLAGGPPPPEPGGPRENPLVLCGLALAGANHRASAGPEEDDGILTSEEIAALDLSGVEWAVLSACDTGLGEDRKGEGILGLRRAFQVAGAATLIMTLWSVDDASTRRWIRGLYAGRLRGLDAAEAVRSAAVEQLGERRRKGLSTHPFYWGSFVAAGSPRPSP
jgi:CHAT domain-containing protein